MRKVVIVQFEADQPQEFTLHADEAQPAADEARRWLDEQFVANECEPLRPSGKVLTADKVLTVAMAAGADRFADPQWSKDFARATSAALGKPVVRVDVPSMTITY